MALFDVANPDADQGYRQIQSAAPATESARIREGLEAVASSRACVRLLRLPFWRPPVFCPLAMRREKTSRPDDSGNGRFWHCVTSNAGPHGGA
jgi:hypothetical protein